MTNIDNILNPEESFKSYQDILIDKYLEDYGEEFEKIIRSRIDRTLYLFDSNPIDTLKFLLDNEDKIHDNNYFAEVEKNYYNYQKLKRRITQKLEKDYYGRLSHFFNISSYPIREDILKLDYQSYNLENTALLKNDSVNDDIKNKIIRRQNKYLEACKEAHVEPLTNPVYINILEKDKEIIEKQKMKYLLSHSTWGKRIIRKFREHDKRIDIDDIVNIMLQKEVGAANFRLDNNFKATTSIVYYPIMKNTRLKSLDRMFFHENRHVVEAGRDSVGLNTHLGNKYQLINEIRTEKHAIEDANELKKKVLWSNDQMPENSYNAYEQLFPYTFTFYEDNRSLLDDIAISGDIGFLEDYYGKEELESYEQFLKESLKVLADNHYKYQSTEKEEEEFKLVNNLNRKNLML